MPRLWASFLLVLSIMSLSNFNIEIESSDDAKPSKSYAGIVIIILIIYVAGIATLGFYPSTLLFVTAILWILNYRRPGAVIGIVVSFLILIYLLFEKTLNINLPEGIFL